MARLLSGTSRARTVTTPTLDPDVTTWVPVVDPEGNGVAGDEARGADGVRETGPAAPDAPDEGGSGHGGRRRSVRPRGGGDRAAVDLRSTWQVVAGSILVPVGVVIILLAWYGAAHTRYVQQQIPYLVSGAFIGLGCMVLGGLLYWAHWLYRIYDQADLNHEELMKAFEQTLRVVADRLAPPGADGALGAGATGTTDDPARASGAGVVPGSSGAVAPARSAYVATSTGSVYHLPSCPVVAHHGRGLHALAPHEVEWMEPCRICLAPPHA